MTPSRPILRRPPRRPLARTAIVCLSFASWGCGEPDSPPSGVADGESIAAGPAAPVDPGAAPADTDGDASASVTADGAPGSAAPAPAPPAMADGPSTAAPGPVRPDPAATTLADCAGALPCRVESADGALAATLTAADGEALDGSGALRIDVVLETPTRDATVAIEPTSFVVAGGQVLSIDASRLGLPGAPGARDESSFPLIAGVPINGHVTFGGTLLGNPARLDRVTLHLSEAGATLAATFADVPLGPAPGAPIDCAGTLPCLWTSADGATTLALTDAAPARWNRATRLIVTWSLASSRPLEIALPGTGRVTNGAGETLEPYGIELGGVESRDGTVLVHALAGGESVTGRIVPRRAPEAGETTLARVEVAVVERSSPRTPRWRPVFLDVPLRAIAPGE